VPGQANAHYSGLEDETGSGMGYVQGPLFFSLLSAFLICGEHIGRSDPLWNHS